MNSFGRGPSRRVRKFMRLMFMRAAVGRSESEGRDCSRAILHEGQRGCQIESTRGAKREGRREKKKAARTRFVRAALLVSLRSGPLLLLVLGDLELGRGRERLARNTVADADGDLVLAGGERGGREQARERQALARIREAAPVLGLLEYLLAVLQERVLHVNRGAQRRLVNAGVVDLHVDAHVLAALVRACDVRQNLVRADGEHAGQLV